MNGFKFWVKAGKGLLFNISFRPSFRPPSPDYAPTDEDEKYYAHQFPLAEVEYDNEIDVTPYGTQNQLALYPQYPDLEARRRNHLRIGRPYLDTRQETVLADRGQPSLSQFVGLRGRFQIFSFLDKVRDILSLFLL